MSGSTTAPAHHKPAIPAAVQRAADEAQRAFDLHNGIGQADDSGDDPGEQPAADTQPQGFTAPREAPTVGTQGDDADWQHRYNSLKGKHDAEMARLQGQVDGLQRVIGGMQQAAVQAQAAPPPPAGPGASDTRFDFRPISDQEREDYGEEFLSVAERAAAQRFAPLIRDMEEKIARLEQGVSHVSTTVQNDARSALYDMLNKEVPDWEAQDRDPVFLNWLGQPDPFSGVARQVLLDKAMQDSNGPRVIAFFKAYRDLQAASSAPASPPPSPAAAPRQPRTSLETLAAPGRGRPGTSAGTPATTDNASVYTQSQIAKFYDDVRRGVWRNDPAGRARREADIVRAATEGRVRAG